MNNKENEYKIIKFIDGELELDVRFAIDENTVWLSQKEMALLFGVSIDSISLHIKKILKDENIDSFLVVGNATVGSTVEEYSIVQTEGNRKVTRHVKLYNLDIILAVGYRTKSNRINKFNDWAKEKLKELKNELIIQKSFNYANNYEIVKFESGDISLDINVSPSEDTVWLTQNDMANLFDTTKQNISNHIINIFNDCELEKNSVVKKSFTTATDGKTYNVDYFNLDMVLSVGYRVNSKRGIEFRRWANKILKEYLIKGYSINNKRCLEHSDIILNLSNDFTNIKKEIDILKDKVDKNSKDISNINSSEVLVNGTLVYEGNVYKAYSFIRNLFLKAKNRLILIDGYLDKTVLDMLDDVKTEITLYTYPSASLTNIDINKFNINHKLNVIKQKELHARFIIVDDDIYQISESIKDVGKKRFVSSKIDFITVDELLNKSK